MTTLRAWSTANLSIGLLSIPVKFYSPASEREGTRFRMIHAGDCGQALKQSYACEEHGPVATDAIGKAADVGGGVLVPFTKEELEALEAPSDPSIRIDALVPDYPTVYAKKAHYLGPNKGGERAFAALREALGERQGVLVGQYAARGREQLVAIGRDGPALLLVELFYSDEVRSSADVPVPEVDLVQIASLPGSRKRWRRMPEVELAGELIEGLRVDRFEPERYTDTWRARREEAIKAKASGAEAVAVFSAEPKAEVLDLMTALKRSIQTKKATKAKTPASPRKAKVGRTTKRGSHKRAG